MNTKLLALVCLSVGAAGQCPVNEGRAYIGVDGCCVCVAGYVNSTTNPGAACSECAAGYMRDSTGVCSNGRAGSECVSGKDFPYFGCSGPEGQYGECTKGPGGRLVFPCVCRDKSGQVTDCGAVIAGKKSGCYPTGPRMYTTFPNEPTVEKKFSLTLIGCGNRAEDEYLVIPAYYDDAMENKTSCEAMGNKIGEVGSECRFDSGEEPVVSLGWGSEGSSSGSVNGTGTTCKNGFLLSGWKEDSDGALNGMSEMTYAGITFTDTGRKTEAETYYRLCKRVDLPGGKGETMWQEIANHNAVVDERDDTFKVARGDAARGAAGMDGECCEGLKIGSFCMDLWIFLLLWLLMACCLGILGYTLHKNKNEIEAKKNNQKYEKFDVDAEMNDLAAKQDEDDDI
eukprot:TRINITY_DN2053_c1_g1_i10.p1 TRINITY_DN2053_c1_g1~~TRINITY_DN2053_c1_g1_i10.p1  ORF type:complete len:397 (+),score=167.40 TRINITY_DN2053_c1_g1_i10:77-1267(+)